MVKIFRTILVALLLVVVVGSTAWAGHGRAKEVPIKGAIAGVDLKEDEVPECAWVLPEPPPPGELARWWKFTTTGTGNVSHLGKVDFTLVNCTSPFADPMMTGMITFTAANGDQLVLEHTGYFEFAFPIATAEYTWDVQSGTGRFEGASGTGESTMVTTIFADGTGSASELSVSGTITYDASNRSNR